MSEEQTVTGSQKLVDVLRDGELPAESYTGLIKPDITGGGSYRDALLLGLTKIISVDLARFNCRLFFLAHVVNVAEL